MNPETRIYNPEHDQEDEEDILKEALIDAGLGHLKAPKPGTASYKKLFAAAQGYMIEVKAGQSSVKSPPPSSGYSERDDYYRPQSSAAAVIKKISSSDEKRREYHDIMAVMLLGRRRKELTQTEADEISNFAAHLTNSPEYLGSWS